MGIKREIKIMLVNLKANKGYNLIMWATTFVILLAVFSIIRMPFKRAIQTKVRQTSDYVLWTSWGTPQNPVLPEFEAPTDDTSRAKSLSAQEQNTYINENNTGRTTVGGIEYDADIKYGAQNSNHDYRVNSGVEDGSQVILNNFNLSLNSSP